SSPLRGKVRISGAKNSVLPIIAASLLTDDVCTVEEVPELDDVYTICSVMEALGSKIDFREGKLTIDNSCVDSVVAPYELVRKIRASFLIMGPLLAREGKVKISLPGGCAIGTRPINLH